jgi:hypothetical protein
MQILTYAEYSGTEFGGTASEPVFTAMDPTAEKIIDRLLFGAVKRGVYTSESSEWKDIQHAVAEQVDTMAGYDTLKEFLDDCEPTTSRSDSVGSMSHSESIDANAAGSSIRASGYLVPRFVYYWIGRLIARQRMVRR